MITPKKKVGLSFACFPFCSEALVLCCVVVVVVVAAASFLVIVVFFLETGMYSVMEMVVIGR